METDLLNREWIRHFCLYIVYTTCKLILYAINNEIYDHCCQNNLQ